MFLLGMTFPVAARIYAADAADAGRRIGAIYSANVFGAIFGSIVAGFLLVPHLGSQGSLVLLAVGNFLIGVALLWVAPNVEWRGGAARAGAPPAALLCPAGAAAARGPPHPCCPRAQALPR